MALSTTLGKIIASLQDRRAAIDRAITALTELASTEGPRRGRKPKILEAIAGGSAKPRRTLSPETRRKMSEAAKRRAARKRAGTGT